MFDAIALSVFPLLLILAAFADLFTMRIPNWLVGLLALAFLVLALPVGFTWAQIGWHAIAGLAVLIVAFSFFAFGWIGGGDAKLAAATALWLGLDLLPAFLIYGALLGGALTLALLAARRFPLPLFLSRVGWIDRLHHPKTGIPYGIALAIAGILVFPQSAMFAGVV